MKKNISINVGGIIFHIEEDGYDKLRDYLSDINRYFANYEDSSEIIADIERRIAEIFLARLNENKQVIIQEDVVALIKTMGQISDFEAVEGYQEDVHQEKEPVYEESDSQQYTYQEAAYEHSQTTGGGARSIKKLYRDERRRLLGGVCSGVAHYFNVDPLWVRLLFLLALFDFLFDFTITGFVFIGYTILWVTVPGSYELEEDEKLRKLFRDPENRVLGGVATGLGAYFGLEATIVRLIFVAGIFAGGIGFVIYLILWFITPEAKSITERMQMQGEPITLSNIEQKIKESLNISDDDNESLLAKILLAPFRLISKLITLISENLRPLARFLLTVFTGLLGVVLFMVSVVTTVALFIALGVIIGVVNEAAPFVQLGDIPLGLIQSSIPVVGLVFAFIAAWIPFLFIGILGLSLIAKKIVTSPIVNWLLLGIWIMGLIGTGITLPMFLTEFQTSGTEKQVVLYEAPAATPLKLDLNDWEADNFSKVKLTITGYEGENIELVKWLESRGKTRQSAIENARNIEYEAELEGAVLRFNSHYKLVDGSPFRGQQIKLKLHIPYGKEFTMTRRLGNILLNTLHPNGYNVSHLSEENKWVYEKEKGLVCLNCPENTNTKRDRSKTGKGRVVEPFSFDTFSSIRITGAYNVEMKNGEDYKMKVEAPSEVISALRVTQKGEVLVVVNESKNKSLPKKEAINITIYAPQYENIQLEGAMNVHIADIEADDLNMDLSGAVDCIAKFEADNVQLKATGASNIKMIGSADIFSVQLLGASMLNAFDFICDDVKVKALGTIEAKVYASESINIMSSVTSNVSYKGNPDKVFEGEMEEGAM